GNVSENAAKQDVRVTVAVVADKADYTAIHNARERLNPAFAENELPQLLQVEPSGGRDAQVQALLGSSEKRAVAVLTGGLAQPTLTGSIGEDGNVRRQIALIIDQARQDRMLATSAAAAIPPAEVRVIRVDQSAGSVAAVRAITARAGQLVLFMLTVLLSGMLLSNLIEEKSNKVIEVLAAAVPVDAIFLGKIVAMLAVSLVGILVWGSGALTATMLWRAGSPMLPDPAVGWPLFVLLVLLYYVANYLLLGALFLGIGSQAATVREVQTLSMPVTVGQMLIFVLASFAVGPFNSPIGIAAAIFPFSSPLTMIARAAQAPEIWPHLLALAWQALWVWMTIRFGSALFRRNVLKSGARRRWFRLRKVNGRA
ncbi:MAG: transporter permease, partial [Alphaproteobacteria bacterium]|nr:transporter permease [Alphaproteobacteria bacterium]